MKAMGFLGIWAVAAIILVSTPVLAADLDSFRCDGGIVHLGDPDYELLNKCGQPSVREGYEGVIWVYDRGPNQFNVRFYVQQGDVTYIQLMDTN